MSEWDLIVIGGGPSGIFGAISLLESRPESRVLVLEAGTEALRKVRISGGGRCNVSNACWDPRELVTRYPRGRKELLGPFNRFGPAHMLDWLEAQGVETKEEDNGRLFPTSDDSRTIITCLLSALDDLGGEVRRGAVVKTIERHDDGYSLYLPSESLRAKRVLLATGSGKPGLALAKSLGLKIIPQVPSLFTLNIPDKRLRELAGLSVPHAQVMLTTAKGCRHEAGGALLITHWGVSGPGILWLSAFAARDLAAVDYRAQLTINWDPSWDAPAAEKWIASRRQQHGKQAIQGRGPAWAPKRLWNYCCEWAGINETDQWSHLSKDQHRALVTATTAIPQQMQGKSVHKEEFVTAGGIALEQINFRTMETKPSPGLYCAGEVLDIDALTGGYNFQAAWTTSRLAGWAIAEALGG